jgi:hypothetical protein
VDRAFQVGDGRHADFEVVFGSAGIWAELLGRVAGYIGTEVRCESSVERRFRVLDFWISHRSFELFREMFVAECDRFNRLVSAEGLVESQEVVGTYYEDGSDGDDLVSAQS